MREVINKRKTESSENIDTDSILTQRVCVLIPFDLDLPKGNNASERTVRNFKVKQKVNGMFISQAGANVYCQIHYITQTAKKNNQNPLSAFLAVAINF